MTKQCEESEFLIVSCIDGELEEEGKRGVFLHLAECGSCRSFWETVTEMKLEAAHEKRQPAPTALDERVNSIAKQNTSARKPLSAWRNLVQRRLFVPAPVAIVLALFLLGGGAGIAFAWIPRPQPAKEVIVPVVCIKLPTVEVTGDIAQPKPAFR